MSIQVCIYLFIYLMYLYYKYELIRLMLRGCTQRPCRRHGWGIIQRYIHIHIYIYICISKCVYVYIYLCIDATRIY
jgi:hypothetical protein